MASSRTDSSVSLLGAVFLAVNLLIFFSPGAAATGTCPYDPSKLSVCATLLDSLIHVYAGTQPPAEPCCSVVCGVSADIDAAICACAALKANVLGVNLDLNVSLQLLLQKCGKQVPSGYVCV